MASSLRSGVPLGDGALCSCPCCPFLASGASIVADMHTVCCLAGAGCLRVCWTTRNVGAVLLWCHRTDLDPGAQCDATGALALPRTWACIVAFKQLSGHWQGPERVQRQGQVEGRAVLLKLFEQKSPVNFGTVKCHVTMTPGIHK